LEPLGVNGNPKASKLIIEEFIEGTKPGSDARTAGVKFTIISLAAFLYKVFLQFFFAYNFAL
jgi:hypothetical protein